MQGHAVPAESRNNIIKAPETVKPRRWLQLYLRRNTKTQMERQEKIVELRQAQRSLKRN